MSRRMTVVFHDDELYTHLKIQAVKRNTAASDIVADAVREWLESHEDAELLPVIESAQAEWREKGGRLWSDVAREMAETIEKREKDA